MLPIVGMVHQMTLLLIKAGSLSIRFVFAIGAYNSMQHAKDCCLIHTYIHT